MTTEVTWPDKREFSNGFGVDVVGTRIKNIRELNTSIPGMIARVYEFHHNFQTSPYVESRVNKSSTYHSATPTLDPTDVVNLIARR